MNSYISFPALGIELNVDNVAFSLFGRDIYWYGIIIAIGFALAVFVGLYLAKKYGMKAETIFDIVIYGAPTAIVCARAYYVAFRWEYYSSHPEDIVKIWNGGIAIYGAIIGAVAVAAIYCRLKKENFKLFVDIGGVGLAIGQCIGRWGNFFNQEAFGGNTTLPWGMTGNKIKSTLYVESYLTSLRILFIAFIASSTLFNSRLMPNALACPLPKLNTFVLFTISLKLSIGL